MPAREKPGLRQNRPDGEVHQGQNHREHRSLKGRRHRDQSLSTRVLKLPKIITPSAQAVLLDQFRGTKHFRSPNRTGMRGKLERPNAHTW